MEAPETPEDYIYLVTTTVHKMPATELRHAVDLAKKHRMDGCRTEIVFHVHEMYKRGLSGNMQDLLELEREYFG